LAIRFSFQLTMDGGSSVSEIGSTPDTRLLASNIAATTNALPVAAVEQVFADVHRVERWLALAALVIVAIWVTIAVRRRGQRPE